ncbi:MAG TPA: glucans biosynthesis glucosyltransferase MdoH [Steroidobacteraceae bacterium]|jgi:membrane glycosyltransferase|nr:glucans biosynthesis glucosyltransferase MdoH [Steroidobacteraceae bacterium]
MTAASTPSLSIDRYLHRQAIWRRSLFFGLTLLTALVGGALMLDIVRAAGLSTLQISGLVMFTALFTWISGAFWTAVAGFVVRLRGHDPAVLAATRSEHRRLSGRTAIVTPIYNEDTDRVFAGVEAIWRSLAQQRDQACFDFFVLSDTRSPEIARAEELAWRALVLRLGAGGRLFYRRRKDNVGRKAGNVAEFVRNWGGAYDYMIVLDADSIMSGQSLVCMAQVMDAHPRVGIVQTLPLLVGRDTFFARLLQFNTRLNGPMFAAGLAFWQLGEGNYWGHNAIIRLKPFAEHCALPRLPGSPPFGGDILSHDIVEAAFMRRAGYQVWLLPDIPGSWEEIPSNIIDYAARDRRWAQGNLQHLGVMPMRGLHWLSRIHMLTGVLSYVTSPMWLLVLVLSSIVTIAAALSTHQYFQPGMYSLFPSWPQYRDGEIAALLSMTITLLILPKLLGATLALRERALRRAFGGAPRLLVSVLLEQFMSMLMAPTMMLFHTSFVIRAILGRNVGWDAQSRGDRGVRWLEALRRHGWHVCLGLAWGGLILALAPAFIWWMMPVIVGMLLPVPFTVLTSRASIGRRLRAAGLLIIPEESAPPPELLTLARHEPLLAQADAEPSAVSVPQRVPLMMPTAPASYVFDLWRQRPEDLHDGLRGGSGRGGVLRGESGSPPTDVLGDRLAAPQTIDLSERDKSQAP